MVDVTSINTLEVKTTKPSLWTRFSKRFSVLDICEQQTAKLHGIS